MNKAKTDKDAEVAKRALECIETIERERELFLAVVRLLSLRSPPGTLAALLAYVDYAEDEETEELIWHALDTVAKNQRKIGTECRSASLDKSPRRRAAAAFLSARYGDERQRDRAVLSLGDADPSVRLRAAQGLLGAADERGVPGLIELLGSSDLAVCWQAEELLRWTAAEQSPNVTVGVGIPEAKAICQQAWRAWWLRVAGRLDLLSLKLKLYHWRRPGLILVADSEHGQADGSAWLVGFDSMPRGRWVGSEGPEQARMEQGATGAAPLHNGCRLVATPRRIVTLNQSGRVIGEILCEKDPHRIRPCFGLISLGFSAPVAHHLSDDDYVTALVILRLPSLKGSEPWLRRRAAELLGEMGPKGVGGVLGLKEALSDSDETVRTAAKEALNKVGADAAEVMVAQIKDKDPKKRVQAVQAMYHFVTIDSGRAAKLFIPELIDSFKDEDALVRASVISSAVCMSRYREQFVPALIRAMEEDDSSDCRGRAAYSLGKFGTKAVVPALLKALKATDPALRHYAAHSLGDVGAVDEAVVPALTEALRDEHAREAAVITLGRIGRPAKDATTTLIEIIDSRITFKVSDPEAYREEIRGHIIHTLGCFGPDGSPAIPVLVRILKDEKESQRLRCEATVALGQIGPARGRLCLISRDSVGLVIHLTKRRPKLSKRFARDAEPVAACGRKQW